MKMNADDSRPIFIPETDFEDCFENIEESLRDRLPIKDFWVQVVKTRTCWLLSARWHRSDDVQNVFKVDRIANSLAEASHLICLEIEATYEARAK